MNTTIKQNIVKSLTSYMEVHGLSQENMEQRSGVNVAYLNALLNGKTAVGKTEIGDSHYKKVADAIGYEYEPVFWRLIETIQYNIILEELLDSKMRGSEKMIIGETGCGKTTTLKEFKKLKPVNTYCIKVSSLHKLKDILNDICDVMKITIKGSEVAKLRKIASKMRDLKLSGKKPILVIDEAENLKVPALRMTKALYDALEDYCPIVLLGTKQLQNKIEKLKEDDEEGMPQLYRRFKAGLRIVRDIEKVTMFSPFLDLVEDEGVREMALNLADNYGELNKYIEPALREASIMNMPLTENFYKAFYKL